MSAQFSIKVEGLEALTRAMDRAGGKLRDKLIYTMGQATTLVQNEAKAMREGRFVNRTGTLRRSIIKRVESPKRGVVGTDVKYAPYVEFGTRPHIIRPKRAKVLAFKDKHGRMIFARQVNHPGSKPYPYMEPAFRENVEPIKDLYDRLILEVVHEMAK
jgi:phage gpG-like protein